MARAELLLILVSSITDRRTHTHTYHVGLLATYICAGVNTTNTTKLYYVI